MEVKLASLDIDDNAEQQQPTNGRIISAKKRRPPSAVAVTAPSDELDVMTPKVSPLVIDEIPVGAAAKQRFF